jgi:hypothetical protein
METKTPLKTDESNLTRLRALPVNRPILYSPIAPQKLQILFVKNVSDASGAGFEL